MGGKAFDTAAGAGEDVFVEAWAQRIADTPAARTALRTIFTAALDDLEPERLSPAVVAAYQTLDREAGLGSDGPAAAPEADRAAFDPQQLYLDSLVSEASFGDGLLGGLLGPLRQLSFWKMKKRARICGETGGHRLISAIRAAGGDGIRIHLMGHSFWLHRRFVDAAWHRSGASPPRFIRHLGSRRTVALELREAIDGLCHAVGHDGLYLSPTDFICRSHCSVTLNP